MADRAFDTRNSLRPHRLRAMMTQEELALKSGVGTRTIRDIESGKVRPQPKTLRLLARALGLEADDRARLAGASDLIAVVPRELPMALAAFTGREGQLDALFAAVDDGAAVITVHGMAGVGKTSLAVRVAHALAPRYPDGQLFVDLHGFTHSTGPRPSIESVLTRVLRSLGLSDRPLPADIDELTARYRSAIADRRILLVLDNAASAEQVDALLPGTPGSLILATSRRDLSSLTGAYSVPLEPPPVREAAAMLSAAVAGRVTEAEAVAVAERCGRLPLALGLAAARLRSRPLWRVEDLLKRLVDEGRLFEEFDLGHRGVAGALHASYLELDTDHRRMLRRLGLVPGDDLDVHAAAALCEVSEERAAPMLESLVDVHLAETRSPGRYRLHDLVRLFAAKVAAVEETESDLDDAVLRLNRVYLHFAYRAAARATPNVPRFIAGETAYDSGLPGFADRDSALSWFRTERGNLESAVAAAERTGRLELAWHLATAFSGFFMYDLDLGAQATVNEIALTSARRLGDAWKEAYALGDAGRQLGLEGRHRDGIRYLEQAVALKRDLGETGDAALTFANIGVLHRRSGRFAEALTVYETALTLVEETAAAPAVSAIVSINMVAPLVRLGRLDDAELRLAEAEALLRPDDDHDRTRIEVFRGVLLRERGDLAGAESMHTTCLAACLRESVPAGITATLCELGEDLLRLDRRAEAVERFGQAVGWAEERADRSLERAARNGLGRALTASGRPEEAIGHLEQAAALAESHEDTYELARAHHGLADAHRLRGDTDAERRYLRRAARGYAACDVPEAAAVTERLDRF
ncbi:ATP-binding protein [Glycomyces buryatensis]|nr:tetratricopeptide repeat protein [Glycomyces buryatensis]